MYKHESKAVKIRQNCVTGAHAEAVPSTKNRMSLIHSVSWQKKTTACLWKWSFDVLHASFRHPVQSSLNIRRHDCLAYNNDAPCWEPSTSNKGCWWVALTYIFKRYNALGFSQPPILYKRIFLWYELESLQLKLFKLTVDKHVGQIPKIKNKIKTFCINPLFKVLPNTILIKLRCNVMQFSSFMSISH